jgi:hypothetical protein
MTPFSRSAQRLVFLLAFLAVSGTLEAHVPIHITHQYANTNAQSLVGLPMGDHKTIVDQKGDLLWSRWGLKYRGLEVPFGMGGWMDGALGMQVETLSPSGSYAALGPAGQRLYRDRFPFVVTSLAGAGLKAEEVAFAVSEHGIGMDVVRLSVFNAGSTPRIVEVLLSGKQRNLPAFAANSELATHDGHLLVLAQAAQGTFETSTGGLVLIYRVQVPGHTSEVLWLKRPYNFRERDQASISGIPGQQLLAHSQQAWTAFWNRGMEIQLPEKEIEDFFYSSIAYLFIDTEYGLHNGLWILDGPTIYRQYWGRSEYFGGIAMDDLGYFKLSEASIDHALRLQRSDGAWYMPLISNQTAWDAVGDYMATVWDYYRFTGDRKFLQRAYPYLMAAARWIHYHREETELPAQVPSFSKPVKPPLGPPCVHVSNPPLKPGEKPYWWGLLPYGYGDSGLPDGYAYAHNFMPLYGVECARRAAVLLGHPRDASWLSKEYIDYRRDIMISIHRSVKLEKESLPYLPAMPTYPEAAYSQTFLAVFPTGIFSPNDPLVTGLLKRIQRTEHQGLPTNMGWLGPSGVWPGESMNIAVTYLLRGNVQKTASLLIAALNHSYTTDVWREEIRVDDSLPVACTAGSQVRIPNGKGTGDMPEAWANANLIILLRDMLLREAGNNLYVLSGIPSGWIGKGESIRVRNAPTTLGSTVSYTLRYPRAGEMTFDMSTSKPGGNMVVRFPLAQNQAILGAMVNGKPVAVSGNTLTLTQVGRSAHVEIEFRQFREPKKQTKQFPEKHS